MLHGGVLRRRFLRDAVHEARLNVGEHIRKEQKEKISRPPVRMWGVVEGSSKKEVERVGWGIGSEGM